MSLKKQFKFQAKLKAKLEKGIEPNEKNRLIREPKDWEIIEKYLKELLIELVDPRFIVEMGWRRKKFIRIHCISNYMQSPKSNGKRIKLKNGSNLEITYEDMTRFCKEYNLKLMFTLNNGYDFKITNKYVKDNTFSYLIGI